MKKLFIGTSSIKSTSGQSHIVHGKRNVDLATPLEKIKTIPNVLYIPSMRKCLLYVGMITDRGYTIFFMPKNV